MDALHPQRGTALEVSQALEESGGDQGFTLFPENHRFQIPPNAHWREVRQAWKERVI